MQKLKRGEFPNLCRAQLQLRSSPFDSKAQRFPVSLRGLRRGCWQFVLSASCSHARREGVRCGRLGKGTELRQPQPGNPHVRPQGGRSARAARTDRGDGTGSPGDALLPELPWGRYAKLFTGFVLSFHSSFHLTSCLTEQVRCLGGPPLPRMSRRPSPPPGCLGGPPLPPLVSLSIP